MQGIGLGGLMTGLGRDYPRARKRFADIKKDARGASDEKPFWPHIASVWYLLIRVEGAIFPLPAPTRPQS